MSQLVHDLEEAFDIILEDTNKAYAKRVREAVDIGTQYTRWDTGRMVGNWNVAFGDEKVIDRDPLLVGGRKSNSRYDTNADLAIDRAILKMKSFDIMKIKTFAIVNNTPYVLNWDDIDGMSRNIELELIGDE